MYYRYGQHARSTRPKNRFTVLWLAAVILAIACAWLAVSGSNASKEVGKVRGKLLEQIRKEAGDARTSSRELLPTSGSRLAAAVATVRQHVYAVLVVNRMSADLYGVQNTFIENELMITNCIMLINECDRKIQAGDVVADSFNELSRTIDVLYDYVINLR